VPEEVADDLEQQAERDRLDRLQLSARLFVKQERYAAAQGAVDDLKAAQPESSEVHELQGDVLRAQGKRKDAREAFQKAIELDRSNARAERKYAELVLFLGEQDRAQRRRQEVLDDPESLDRKEEKPRSPLTAAALGCVFPGLGQFYNKQREKGLALLATGAVIVLLMLAGLLEMALASSGGRENASMLEKLTQLSNGLGALPWWQWLVMVFGGLVLMTAQVYGVVDAYRVAAQMAKSADDLGIEAPG